jgi:archaellum biogenesis ATPase FlaH
MTIETKQNADYGYDIQKLYLEMMLADSETFVRCQGIFNHELFDRKLQNSAKFINDYVNDNNVLPTYQIVNAASNVHLARPDGLHEAHFDWLLTDFETFIKHKGLEHAIIQSADLLEAGEYGAVEALVKQAVQVGLTKDLGTDYFLDPRTRLMQIKDKNGQLSTGWETLDKSLYGGMNRGELNIFAGQSGAGKSLFLANLGVNWALQGLNVVYLTLELSENLVSMRIDSMMTGIASRDVFRNIDDVELKVRTLQKKSGSLQVKYMPSGKTANDIRSYLKEYEIKSNKKVDILLVDYLDLLMPMSKKISAENLYIKDKYVSEELRNLAVEKQCVLVTAAQLNRGSVEEVEFDHSHISGGLSKIQTADNVFGIFTSRAMRERGKYQLQLMKTRSSSGVGHKVDLDFNIDTLRITDPGEEGQTGTMGSPGGSATSTSIMQSLQRTSTVSNDPVKVPKGTADSSKVRQLINNLNNDDL